MKKRHKETRGATTSHVRAVQSREEKTILFSRLTCEADRELLVENSMSGPNRAYKQLHMFQNDKTRLTLWF